MQDYDHVECLEAAGWVELDYSILHKHACPVCYGFCPPVSIEDERESVSSYGTTLEWTYVYKCQDCGADYFTVEGT